MIAALIWKVGIGALRSITTGQGRGEKHDPDAAEDVEGLDVFLICGECGTEFRVTRLGELQVPRHCGEPRQGVRRPAAGTP